eukprot:TRINITY_DN5100_c0_g1_i1.p1 TRINITY_DN5100_c0_g1~~TRINITY_DN5100_c0_g1_i1.p1  ORF type:complete len:373 (+),score=59.68 TRINITY_DN5100_c0_g1_i1:49-1167(+)
MLADLPIELWVVISSHISNVFDLLSLSLSCTDLYSAFDAEFEHALLRHRYLCRVPAHNTTGSWRNTFVQAVKTMLNASVERMPSCVWYSVHETRGVVSVHGSLGMRVDGSIVALSNVLQLDDSFKGKRFVLPIHGESFCVRNCLINVDGSIWTLQYQPGTLCVGLVPVPTTANVVSQQHRSIAAVARSFYTHATVSPCGELHVDQCRHTRPDQPLYPHILWDYVVPTRRGFCAVSADGHRLLIKASPVLSAHYPDRLVHVSDGRIVQIAAARRCLMFLTDTQRLYSVRALLPNRANVLSANGAPQVVQAELVLQNVLDVVHTECHGFWALTSGSDNEFVHLQRGRRRAAHGAIALLDMRGAYALRVPVDKKG